MSDGIMVPDAKTRTIRTALASAVSNIFLIVIVAPEIIRVTIEVFDGTMPDNLRLWLLGAAAFLTAVTTLVTRVMAMPIVNNLLSRYTPFGTENLKGK